MDWILNREGLTQRPLAKDHQELQASFHEPYLRRSFAINQGKDTTATPAVDGCGGFHETMIPRRRSARHGKAIHDLILSDCTSSKSMLWMLRQTLPQIRTGNSKDIGPSRLHDTNLSEVNFKSPGYEQYYLMLPQPRALRGSRRREHLHLLCSVILFAPIFMSISIYIYIYIYIYLFCICTYILCM